jgi:hypothetical protein
VVGDAGPHVLRPLERIGVAEASGSNVDAGCLDKLASTVEEATSPESELLGELLGADGELPI